MRRIINGETLPFILVLLVSIALFFYEPALGSLIFIVGCLFLWRKVKEDEESGHEIRAAIEKIYQEMDGLNRGDMYELPIALVIVNLKGEILWFNNNFDTNFGEDTEGFSFYGKSIQDELSLDYEKLLKDRQYNFSYDEADYAVVSNKFEDGGDTLVLLHFFDITVQKKQQELYKEYGTVFGYIIIDNYDEAIEQLPTHERSLATSKLEMKISEWAKRHEAFILPYENDHYLLLFEKERLKDMETERFKVLDSVREAFKEDAMQVTLSIGVGVSDEIIPIREGDEIARAALDIALARGGDQAVVRRDDKMSFFGGSSEATERRTKVKARIKAHGLREFIKEADNVLIMGHQSPDMDCLGAAIGLMGSCRKLGKTCKMVLSEINYSIKELFEYISEEERYENAFIAPKELDGYLRAHTLLIVVDTQNADYVEVPEILETVGRVVVIDHHRRSGKFISNTVLSYTEVYASSACELVTELLQYFEIKDIIDEVEANALLAGICMDTKMFTLKTGVRTFEAASYLRRKGADTVIAKTMLQDDFDTYNSRSLAVANAKTYYEHFAVTEIENNTEFAKVIAAQAADELLNIKGIQASFVILKHDDGLFVSGRSMGEINVQLILEKLGGGGHLTMAGAQLPEVDDLEAGERLLLIAIDEYMVDVDKREAAASPAD